MFKVMSRIVIFFFTLVFMISCGGGGGSDDGEDTGGNNNPTSDELKASIAQMDDLTGVIGLVTTGNDPTSVRPALKSTALRTANLPVDLDPNSVYKVLPDGSLERVIITDDNDQEIDRGFIQPAAIRDIDANYMVMYFLIKDQSTEAQSYFNGTLDTDTIITLSAYLVHKPTGLAYNVESAFTGGGVLNNDMVAGGIVCEMTDDTGMWTGDFPISFVSGIGYLSSSNVQVNDCDLGEEYFGTYRRFESDDQGNLYVNAPYVTSLDENGNAATYINTVYKIDTSSLGSGSITAQALQTQFNVSLNKWNWAVDPTGSYLFFHTNSDSYSLDIASGQFTDLTQQLATAFPGFNSIWDRGVYEDLEGKLYFWGRQVSGQDHLFKASSVAPGTVQLVDMGDTSSFGLSDVGNADLGNYSRRMVVNGQLLYMEFWDVGNGPEFSGHFFELDATRGIIVHDEPANQFVDSAWDYATFSNGYFYYFGDEVNSAVGTVYRYNPSTQTGILFPTNPSPLVQASLQVSEVKVIDDSSVWFKALRLTDSATVYGTADIEAGTIEITGTTEADEPVVFVMEAIIPADFLSIDGSYSDWSIDLRVTSDATNDGSTGHELAHLSQQQSATQLFGLVEFDQDTIETVDAATILTLDGLFDIVIQSNEAFIIDLSDDSETTFNDAGAISSIGQAVEFSVPLSALSGVGTTPVVTVRSVSLQAISAASTYSAPDHTVTITLPRALTVEDDDVTIQLVGDYALTISSTVVSLVDTSGPTITDITSATSGLSSTSIVVTIADADLGSPGSLTPATTDRLDITEDEM